MEEGTEERTSGRVTSAIEQRIGGESIEGGCDESNEADLIKSVTIFLCRRDVGQGWRVQTGRDKGFRVVEIGEGLPKSACWVQYWREEIQRATCKSD